MPGCNSFSSSLAPLHREHAVDPDVSLIEAVSQHINRHIGPVTSVFHDFETRIVHVDVHVVAPRPERPFFTLVTSGMSARGMRGSCEHGLRLDHAELMLCLEPDWPFSLECGSVSPREAMWPVRMLHDLALLPHECDTVLWGTHTVELVGEDGPFHGALIQDPVSLPVEAQTFQVTPSKTVELFAVYPLYKKELKFRVKRGSSDLLWRRLRSAGVTDVVDPRRRCVV